MNIENDEYGNFYEGYVKLSNNIPLDDLLSSNAHEMRTLFEGLTEKYSLYRYEENKWTLKEVFGHLIDTERIFTYRALAIARGEPNALPGFDQDLYVQNAEFNDRPFNQLKEQYEAVRRSTIALFTGFAADELMKRGFINNSSFTVRAIGYVIAGHELHHLDIIEQRYLPGLTG